MPGMCTSRMRQDVFCRLPRRKNSSPEVNISTVKPSDRISLPIAMRTEVSSSTTESTRAPSNAPSHHSGEKVAPHVPANLLCVGKDDLYFRKEGFTADLRCFVRDSEFPSHPHQVRQ